MAQPAQPQPQEDLPFLLLRTILAATMATRTISTALTAIVPRFSTIHVYIRIPPFPAAISSARHISFSTLRHSILNRKIISYSLLPRTRNLKAILFYRAAFTFTFPVGFIASL